MYNALIVEVSDGIATICLNRPERHNALNPVLCRELAAAIGAASKDAPVNVIRLKGAGKGFCAGIDLTEIDNDELAQAGNIVRELFNPIIVAIKDSPKPVVAEVAGSATGAGSSLAFACDAVFASQKALFNLPFLKLSLLPDTGSSFFLVRQLGYKKAFALFTDKQFLSAQEAASCGLINHACDEAALEEDCLTYCMNLSLSGPEHLKDLKRLLQAAETGTLADILDLEAYYQDKAAKSPEFAAAVRQVKARR